MLDIELFRTNPSIVKASQRKRGLSAKPVDEVVRLDKQWRSVLQKLERLKHERNVASEKINRLKKEGKPIARHIRKVKKIVQDIGTLEGKAKGLKAERDKRLLKIPNVLLPDVPFGKSEADNKLLKTVGRRPKIKSPKPHQEIVPYLIDTKKAAEVTGARFYYLKGELVKLNQALLNFALDFLKKKGFTLLQPPYLLRREALSGAITFDVFEDAIYKIQGEDLYLIGTAEHAINAYRFNELIKARLPLRYAGISPCFRREAGAHGKDTKGIFRVHQFEKIEQFVFCKPEQAESEFKLILNNAEQIAKALEIPYRLMFLCSADTGNVPAKTIDLEGWFPAQNKYRELGSCSNCTTYQARRSGIRYQSSEGPRFVYTLNNTALATERTIACLLENHQQMDGSVKIPKVLWKYTGFKVIKPKK